MGRALGVRNAIVTANGENWCAGKWCEHHLFWGVLFFFTCFFFLVLVFGVFWVGFGFCGSTDKKTERRFVLLFVVSLATPTGWWRNKGTLHVTILSYCYNLLGRGVGSLRRGRTTFGTVSPSERVPQLLKLDFWTRY